METPAVRTQGLTKIYRGALRRSSVRALDDLDLEVAPGEIFGLLGPNGAGKTTLIKVLLGIVHPTAGAASLFGRPVAQPEARARVGFLPEDHRFPSFLTAGEMLDLYGRMSGVSEAARRARIPALLERVGMAKWRETKIRKFSKGMVQRVGLAQALLNEPDLVFLDEPTDGVDPVGRREIRDLLVWLRGEGKTVFLNSHLLSEVEQVCTRVAILDGGRMVRTGTVAELTSVESVYEIAATPFPPALLEALEEQITKREAAPPGSDPALEHYRLRAATRADLNALLDRLRSEGVEIEAIQPLRRSLENYFIEVVQPVRGKGERASGREGEDSA